MSWARWPNRPSRKGLETYLVTADKDLMQLVSPTVKIYSLRQVDNQQEILDAAGVQQKFGVPPEHVIDVLALMGDSSDNIPGVRGIGEKTALKLIQDYGDLETVLAKAADDLKPKGWPRKSVPTSTWHAYRTSWRRFTPTSPSPTLPTIWHHGRPIRHVSPPCSRIWSSAACCRQIAAAAHGRSSGLPPDSLAALTSIVSARRSRRCRASPSTPKPPTSIPQRRAGVLCRWPGSPAKPIVSRCSSLMTDSRMMGTMCSAPEADSGEPRHPEVWSEHQVRHARAQSLRHRGPGRGVRHHGGLLRGEPLRAPA